MSGSRWVDAVMPRQTDRAPCHWSSPDPPPAGKVVPCGCFDPRCPGWQVVPVDTPVPIWSERTPRPVKVVPLP
jgi:hypothetical protein